MHYGAYVQGTFTTVIKIEINFLEGGSLDEYKIVKGIKRMRTAVTLCVCNKMLATN